MGTALSDTFTDTAGTLLSAHTPDIGGAWTASGKFLAASGTTTPTCSIDASGHLIGSAAGANQLYMNAVTPDSPDVIITVVWRAAALTTTSSLWGVAARVGGTVGTPGDRYYARYSGNSTAGSRKWDIGKYIGTSSTLLASFAEQPTAAEHTIVFQISGTTLTLTVDGVQKISTTDATITTTGLIGTIGSAGTASAYMDNLTAVTPSSLVFDDRRVRRNSLLRR